MRNPILFLYVAEFKGKLRRVRYDLAQELVLIFCAGVLLLLFGYVFHDFLFDELKSMDAQFFATTIRSLIAAAILALALVLARRTALATHSVIPQWHTLGLALGASARVLAWYRLSWLVIEHIFALSILALLCSLEHVSLSTKSLSILAGASVAVWIGAFCYFRSKSGPHSAERPSNDLVGGKTVGHVLTRWRFIMLTKRNRTSRLCLLGVALLALAELVLDLRSSPPLVLGFLAFLLGLGMTFAVAFQLGDDLPVCWLEKNAGVSHDGFIKAYDDLCRGLALGLFTLLLALGLACHLPELGAAGATILLNHVKIALMAAVSLMIFPSLMLQIEGRKPIIQLLSTFLLGLFIATTVYLNPIAFVLVFLLRNFAFQAQHDRFYRA